MLHFKGRLRAWLQYGLRCAGKGEEKVASVFGTGAEASHQAVLHLRQGAPDVPVWLFTTVEPLPETQLLCERIYRNPSALALLAAAERRLWRRWVAISVGTWTGESGPWVLKLAPFLVPPFRVLIVNGDGGFFTGTPSNIFTHSVRAGWDAVQLGWSRVRKVLHSARERIHNARVHGWERIHAAGERARWAIHPTLVRGRDLRDGFSKLAAATGLLILTTLLRWMS